MYAIVEMQGLQYKVEAGKKLFVNRIAELEKGAEVTFEKVLLVENNGEVTVGAPVVAGAKVVCEVLDNECRGEKVLVFHKKRRKGYRKLNGHRQDLTNLVVKEIVLA
jgi:large subunit ribosomal protein L21